MATDRLAGGAAAALAVGFLLCGSPPAEAGGVFNLPSSFRQCFGYGSGAGYHAPLVLQNPVRATTEAKPIVYTARPPRPHACRGGFCSSVTALEPAAPVFHHYPAAPTPAPPQPAAITRPPGLWRPAPPVTREPASPSDTVQPESIPLPPAS